MSRRPVFDLLIVACLMVFAGWVTLAQVPAQERVSDLPNPPPATDQAPVSTLLPPPAATDSIPASPPVAKSAPTHPDLTISRGTISSETYVVDLLDIVNETQSIDAYLVTTTLLSREKDGSRAAIPLLIRNAERLGIFDRFALEEGSRGAALANHVAKLIEHQAGFSPAATTAHGAAPVNPPAVLSVPAPPAVQTQLQELVSSPVSLPDEPAPAAQTQRPGTTGRLPPTCVPQPRPRPADLSTRPPVEKAID